MLGPPVTPIEVPADEPGSQSEARKRNNANRMAHPPCIAMSVAREERGRAIQLVFQATLSQVTLGTTDLGLTEGTSESVANMCSLDTVKNDG
jgi:hypothetical protein